MSMIRKILEITELSKFPVVVASIQQWDVGGCNCEMEYRRKNIMINDCQNLH